VRAGREQLLNLVSVDLAHQQQSRQSAVPRSLVFSSVSTCPSTLVAVAQARVASASRKKFASGHHSSTTEATWRCG